MNPRARQSLYVALGMCGFAMLSWVIFTGYLTPEMMVYFLSFKWCF
jgi:hypothetical protein